MLTWLAGAGTFLIQPICLAGLLASLVGMGELVGRYRDAPLAAARKDSEPDLRATMTKRVQAISGMALGNQDKLLLLAIELLTQFGDGVVNMALSFVGNQAPAASVPASGGTTVT